MKKCTKCGILKDENSFSHSSQTKCHLSSWCKKCQVMINRKYKNRKWRKDSSKKSWRKICEKGRKYGLSVRAIKNLGFKLALEVYDRAKRKCEWCGEENDLTIHHKDGNGRHNEEGGLEVNNNSNNLEVLCRRCHGGLHSREYHGTHK